MTITLYFAPFTRATRPRWLLEELGVPYDLVTVDLAAGAQRDEAYLRDVHPLGKVPALKEDGPDGNVIIESTAIVATLADRHLDKGLAPAPSDPARAQYLQWLFYGAVTLEPVVVRAAGRVRVEPPPSPEEKARLHAIDVDDFHAVAVILERTLTGQDWLLSSGFSAADVVVGAVAIWANSLKLCEDLPAVKAWVARCKARPAFRISMK